MFILLHYVIITCVVTCTLVCTVFSNHTHLHLNCTIQHCHACIQIACIYCLQQLNKFSPEHVTERQTILTKRSRVDGAMVVPDPEDHMSKPCIVSYNAFSFFI